VREYSRRLVEAEASTTEADEIERWAYLPFSHNLGPLFINPRRYIEDILARISGWAKLSDGAAFLKQNQILVGIEQCYRDLTACTGRFTVRRPQAYSTRKGHSSILFFLQVASSMVQSSESQEREKERQCNHQQLIDMIAELREELRKLHSIPLQVVPSPRSKAADCECFKTLSWIITHCSANDRFRESFQS